MFEIREKPKMVEKALLIGAYFDKREQEEAASLLEELRELVDTLGIPVSESILVHVKDSNRKFLTGSGKAKELTDYAKATGCDVIIFDNQLAPMQQRAWETLGGVTVIDREEVILDIFAMRARTAEARLQVDLARQQYALPRLARMWGHLDRQGGGGGSGSAGAARGEGESQLEVDRRLARKRIDTLKRQIEDIKQIRLTQRKERQRVPVPQAAIVGYTNAGKSTLLNSLTGADVLAEDKLFATLDPTTRKVQLPDGQQLLLTDTVGFIRALPHRLVESFKATLEEAVVADFLIHVLDASQERVFQFYQTTMEVLKELHAHEKRMLIVLNKIDLVPPERRQAIAAHFDKPVCVSLHTGEGVDELLLRLSEMMLDRTVRLKLRLPQSEFGLMSVIHKQGKLLSQEYEGNDVLLETILPKRFESQFAPFAEQERVEEVSKV
ncbi:MAG TPA: GTPase HflX [Verrucomicrobiales bacterium]|jgi:GTP-binding protein HflX|nr:GTPase HflX [Verrucomicrobiales bacterium]